MDLAHCAGANLSEFAYHLSSRLRLSSTLLYYRSPDFEPRLRFARVLLVLVEEHLQGREVLCVPCIYIRRGWVLDGWQLQRWADIAQDIHVVVRVDGRKPFAAEGDRGKLEGVDP